MLRISYTWLGVQICLQRVEQVDIQLVISVFTQVGDENWDDLIGGEEIEDYTLEVPVLVESNAYDAVEYFQRCLPHPHP